MTTSKKYLKKKDNLRKNKKMEDDLKQKNGRQPKKIKWKMNQSTEINLIGCVTIVNSPSIYCNPFFESICNCFNLSIVGCPQEVHHSE